MGETVAGFEDFECYQISRRVHMSVAVFCKTLPADEKYRLPEQIIRSSRSVTVNIAEGYGRHHHKEILQYLRQARGSLYETLEHFHNVLD